MSEVPPVKPTSWAKRKIAGIPVLYLAAGFVLVLVAIAWNMKSAPKTDSSEDTTATEKASDTILNEADYPLPLGTVYPDNSNTTDNSGNTSISDNDEWLKRGVMFLSDNGYSPGDAQQALSLYLEGGELSYDQGAMRDKVIRELGMPPFPGLIGGTRPDVGRSQGPLPRSHTVRNVNENTAAKLAGIYYARTDTFAVKVITDANNGRTSYNVGDSVTVPILPKPAVPPTVKPPTVKPPTKPTQRTHTVVRGDTLSAIAKRYYGDARWYPAIAEANKISNPNLIYPGQKLIIP